MPLQLAGKTAPRRGRMRQPWIPACAGM